MAMFDINVIDIVHGDLDQLGRDQLITTANGLRNAYLDCLAEKDRQREEIKDLKGVLRASSFASSMSSFEMQPSWVRAELDSPGDTTFSCFGPRSKYRNVLVYDRNGSSLETRPRETLRDQQGVIYSRIPSQRTNAVHVFVECATTVVNGAPRRFRISTNDRIPPGFVPHCTIHFKRLSWSTRWKIWNGQIKWLFILRNPNTGSDAACPDILEKSLPLSSVELKPGLYVK